MGQVADAQFQSLTWVERLSDRGGASAGRLDVQFQSLTWVERLSDHGLLYATDGTIGSFNPSPGLNVFQTPQDQAGVCAGVDVSIPHLG